MEPLPQLESCLRLAFEARHERHPSGVWLASWFVRAPTRGRRRSDLDARLLFPPELRARLGADAERAVDLAMDPASWRSCPSPRPALPVATREWLAQAALALGKAEGFALTWALLRSVAELESVAQRLLGSRTPPASGAPGEAPPAASPLPSPRRVSGPPNGCPTGPTTSPSGF